MSRVEVMPMRWFRPERPAWLRAAVLLEAFPVHVPRRLITGNNLYTMACTIAGRDPVICIEWKAGTPEQAEDSFLEWLSDGWAKMSHTFYNDVRPDYYVFRTGAITGFVTYSPGPR